MAVNKRRKNVISSEEGEKSVGGSLRQGVRIITVDERGAGQRIDNFVLRVCPNVPKTRIYRALRKGEIRVNKGRARPERRVDTGDEVRLPPLEVANRAPTASAPPGWQARIDSRIVHEDEQLLVINKPSGIAVHGGSGLQFGLIETLRTMRPEARFLELIHRLDRETSGLILVAKKPAALRAMHDALRKKGSVEKTYLALVAGAWPRHLRLIEAPLERYERRSGERMVKVSGQGKPSSTRFRIHRSLDRCTLVTAQPLTGRTHQIRVHAAHAGHPLLGDDKYADDAALELTRRAGLRRLFLHATQLRFTLDGRPYDLRAGLDEELETILEKMHK